ncbi:MAG: type II toxin-antitoxin system HicB family antitoxin [Candidatus Methanofastidiosia archaeon]
MKISQEVLSFLQKLNILILPLSYKRFRAILGDAEQMGQVVYVPSLPGGLSQGKTKEEAFNNVREAIEVYLDIGEAQIETEPHDTMTLLK